MARGAGLDSNDEMPSLCRASPSYLHIRFQNRSINYLLFGSAQTAYAADKTPPVATRSYPTGAAGC
jgi:hypothetical protein